MKHRIGLIVLGGLCVILALTVVGMIFTGDVEAERFNNCSAVLTYLGIPTSQHLERVPCTERRQSFVELDRGFPWAPKMYFAIKDENGDWRIYKFDRSGKQVMGLVFASQNLPQLWAMSDGVVVTVDHSLYVFTDSGTWSYIRDVNLATNGSTYGGSGGWVKLPNDPVGNWLRRWMSDTPEFTVYTPTGAINFKNTEEVVVSSTHLSK